MLIDDRHVHPTVYARELNITFNVEIQDGELRSRTEKFLTGLTRDLRDAGCRLIGHIKGLFAAHEKGYLMFSVTSFEEAAQFKGKLDAGITAAIMTVNVIVYGVGFAAVEDAFKKSFRKHLSARYVDGDTDGQ